MKQFRINLPNRDGALLTLVSEDEKLWNFEVDDEHKYVLEYMRVGYMEDNKTIDFVDPSGGPFIRVHCPIDTENTVEAIVILDDKLCLVTSKMHDKNIED